MPLPVDPTTLPPGKGETPLNSVNRIATSVHPAYGKNEANWVKWRFVYESGDDFIQAYLVKFSNREDDDTFRRRKSITPIPAFAKGAINEIKNSIFQRMVDVSRQGGPLSYTQAISGQLAGVDLEGATMNWFIGNYVLPELLTMKKVGVFVDSPRQGPTLADKGEKHPYFYAYKAEDIRNWSFKMTGDRRELQSVLLRDKVITLDEFGLATGETERFRRMSLNSDGKVVVDFINTQGEVTASTTLTLTKIPFVIFEISDSLLKDVSNHQIALMNLESSDVSYALTANFPFYIEKGDARGNDAVKKAKQAYLATNPNAATVTGAASDNDNDIIVGATIGRRYSQDPPGFINPSTEPLLASMQKQESLKRDTRALVHLAVSNLQPKMASAESKGFDNQGLEAGLSYIGLELEHGENQLAKIWAMYESSNESISIQYPRQYSLKSVDEIEKEVKQLLELRNDTPSLTAKKELNKKIIDLILSTKVTSEVLSKIYSEIDSAKVASTDAKTMSQDIKDGVVSPDLVSVARGYPEGEVEKAALAHAERVARILEAQQPKISQAQSLDSASGLPTTSESGTVNPQASGASDLGTNPNASKDQKVGKPVRGAGK